MSSLSQLNESDNEDVRVLVKGKGRKTGRTSKQDHGEGIRSKGGEMRDLNGLQSDDLMALLTKCTYGYLRVVNEDGTLNAAFPLDEREISIGRSSDNLLRLGTSTVSRRHAKLDVDERGCMWLESITSQTTMVDGEPVMDGERVRLFHNSAVWFGSEKFIFEYPRKLRENMIRHKGMKQVRVARPEKRDIVGIVVREEVKTGEQIVEKVHDSNVIESIIDELPSVVDVVEYEEPVATYTKPTIIYTETANDVKRDVAVADTPDKSRLISSLTYEVRREMEEEQMRELMASFSNPLNPPRGGDNEEDELVGVVANGNWFPPLITSTRKRSAAKKRASKVMAMEKEREIEEEINNEVVDNSSNSKNNTSNSTSSSSKQQNINPSATTVTTTTITTNDNSNNPIGDVKVHAIVTTPPSGLPSNASTGNTHQRTLSKTSSSVRSKRSLSVSGQSDIVMNQSDIFDEEYVHSNGNSAASIASSEDEDDNEQTFAPLPIEVGTAADMDEEEYEEDSISIEPSHTKSNRITKNSVEEEIIPSSIMGDSEEHCSTISSSSSKSSSKEIVKEDVSNSKTNTPAKTTSSRSSSLSEPRSLHTFKRGTPSRCSMTPGQKQLQEQVQEFMTLADQTTELEPAVQALQAVFEQQDIVSLDEGLDMGGKENEIESNNAETQAMLAHAEALVDSFTSILQHPVDESNIPLKDARDAILHALDNIPIEQVQILFEPQDTVADCPDFIPDPQEMLNGVEDAFSLSFETNQSVLMENPSLLDVVKSIVYEKTQNVLDGTQNSSNSEEDKSRQKLTTATPNELNRSARYHYAKAQEDSENESDMDLSGMVLNSSKLDQSNLNNRNFDEEITDILPEMIVESISQANVSRFNTVQHTQIGKEPVRKNENQVPFYSSPHRILQTASRIQSAKKAPVNTDDITVIAPRRKQPRRIELGTPNRVLLPSTAAATTNNNTVAKQTPLSTTKTLPRVALLPPKHVTPKVNKTTITYTKKAMSTTKDSFLRCQVVNGLLRANDASEVPKQLHFDDDTDDRPIQRRLSVSLPNSAKKKAEHDLGQVTKRKKRPSSIEEEE